MPRTGDLISVSGYFATACCWAKRRAVEGRNHSTCPACGEPTDWRFLSEMPGDPGLVEKGSKVT
jgi:hypothetical protein